MKLWMTILLLCILSVTGFAYTTYMVEVSHESQFFIINGNKYKAQTVCFGVYEGDRVMFIKGSPYGACSTATIVNMRTHEVCELWCE